VQGFTASQGIFVRDVSRRFRDVFGVYVPVTLEIFDNRPNIANEPDKRVYKVEIRDGTSPKRAVFRKTYSQSGVYTERLYINYGPGFYTLSVLMKSTHGIYYEDIFHVGYNVHFMDGFGLLLYLPLFLAAIPIFFCSKKKANWDDDDFGEDERDGKGLGISRKGVSYDEHKWQSRQRAKVPVVYSSICLSFDSWIPLSRTIILSLSR
jgi:hypothetical protein